MKFLPLSNTALDFVVDDEDYAWASKFKWFLGGQCRRSKTRTGQIGYPTTCVAEKGKRKLTKITAFLFPRKVGFVVDHINGDPLDNRRSNLRYLTHGQNLNNTTNARSDSTTGYKGVSPHSRRPGIFSAQVFLKGRRVFVGNFKSAEEAHLARQRYIDLAAENPAMVPEKGKRKNNTSGFRGVGFRDNRWIARKMVAGKSINLGSFKEKTEAIQALIAYESTRCL